MELYGMALIKLIKQRITAKIKDIHDLELELLALEDRYAELIAADIERKVNG